MAPTALEKEDKERDAAFQKAMHGKSSGAAGGWASMINKDKEAQKAAIDNYFKHWDEKQVQEDTEETRAARRAEYASLTRHYYNISTDLYEYGWGKYFHFCRFAYGEPFYQAIARHEHYLAHCMGIKPGMSVLDVGCGVGGPAREIVKFTDANVIGLNNNDYQIERAKRYTAQEGLSHKLKYEKGDFMQMSFPDNAFDAVYAIEATVHAPSLEGIYSEIFRVVKPGGVFGVYEWLMTDKFDNDNKAHRDIRIGIEQGNGISNMEKIEVALKAIKAAGFELELNEDLAEKDNQQMPWYWPLSADWRYLRGPMDLFTIWRLTWTGRRAIHGLIGLMEKLWVAPPGCQKAADNLAIAADNLVWGGQQKLFTPMYLMVARKPKA